MLRVVIDTNVFVAALLSPHRAPRDVFRLCLQRAIQPLMGMALLAEYESLLRRPELFAEAPLTLQEREELLNAFLHVCAWVKIHFLWRPNLPDESDNHLIELAVAGNADYLITGNLRDLVRGELLFPGLCVIDPRGFVEEWSEAWRP